MAASDEELLKTVESVLYLALLHGDYSSLGALLKDVQTHNREKTGKSQTDMIYLTNACGEDTGYGADSLSEEDYAKVAFEEGSGCVLPYIVQIGDEKHVLGNLEVAYKDDFWGYDGRELDSEGTHIDRPRLPVQTHTPLDSRSPLRLKPHWTMLQRDRGHEYAYHHRDQPRRDQHAAGRGCFHSAAPADWLALLFSR